jgi:hypothetical protein
MGPKDARVTQDCFPAEQVDVKKGKCCMVWISDISIKQVETSTVYVSITNYPGHVNLLSVEIWINVFKVKFECHV